MIFWNNFGYDKSLPDETFLSIKGISKSINIIADDSVTFNPSRSRSYIYRENLKQLDDHKIHVPFEILYKIGEDENNIYKVLDRNFKGLGLRPTLSYINDYYNMTLRILHQIVLEYGVNIALFFDTPHHPFDYIAYLYFRTRNIHNFVSKELPSTHTGTFRRRLYITSNFPFFDNHFLKYYDNFLNKKLYLSELPSDLHQFIIEYNENSNIEYNKQHLGRSWNFNYILKYLVKRTFINIMKLNFFLMPVKANTYLYRLTIDKIKRKKLLDYYIMHTNKPNYHEDYLYFPLHYQPEATTIPLGNRFSDQLLAISYILDNLSNNKILYIREHPAFWHTISNTDRISDARSKAFYDRLISNANVKLISPDVNHLDLIKYCQAVVTVTGTVAFEAFGMSKRAYVFGDYIYSSMANVIKVPSQAAKEELSSSKKMRYDYSKQFYATLLALNEVSTTMNQPLYNLVNLKSQLESELAFISSYIDNKVNC